MQTMTTAATLNAMIQRHIDSLSIDGYVSHSGVYLHPADRSGCNWNIEVNCNQEALTCGPSISRYIDLLRSTYGIPPDDKTAVAHDAPHGTRPTRGAAAGSIRLFD